MAILIPDVPKDCPNSERLVYEKLGRDLPKNWIVLHSLGLGGHATKIWGEADMVVLSEHGVFIVEVKGGSVSCEGGVWTFAGDFQSYTKREGPWSQAQGGMRAVEERLQNADPAFGDVLFGYGVAMPFALFVATGAEIIQEVLVDRRKFGSTLRSFITRLESYWRDVYLERHGKNRRGLTAEQIARARQILRPDVEAAMSLGSYLTGVESLLLQLTNEQIRASRRLAANPRTVVRGAAGTGKTVLAVERAKQLAREGKKTLFLCYNQLLAKHVREGLASEDFGGRLEVRHAHSLYRQLIENAGIAQRLDAEDAAQPGFFAKLFPSLAMEALCLKAGEPLDVLVVDEAQDLLTPEHLDVFDLLLRDGLRRGKWHLFLDRSQNIYGGEVQKEVEERLDELAPAYDDLSENCRNTRQVALQASIVSGIDLAVAGAPSGPVCETIYYRSTGEALKQLEKILRGLIAQDVGSRDIAILSTRRHENSLLAGQTEFCGRRLATPDEEAALRAGALLFSTMHAFKGLERQVVIAIDMAETGEKAWSMLHYAGLSRARLLLHILLPETARQAYHRQAEAFGRRLQNRPT